MLFCIDSMVKVVKAGMLTT